MHRHGYKGKKFNREKDQRQALLKSLAEALIKNESIETTLPKAKAVAGYTEKLITKAKKGDLAARRQVIASLQTIESAHKLVDDLAPRLTGRVSGYLSVKRTNLRRGDGAQMAKVSFVDDLTAKAEDKPVAKKSLAVKKTAAKPKVEAKK
jgi:large subunit ribosomal protein L17